MLRPNGVRDTLIHLSPTNAFLTLINRRQIPLVATQLRLLTMIRMRWKYEFRGINKAQFRLEHDWKKPTGYDTKIQIYNERLRANVPLIFPNKNYVKWYMCGPTVYDASHIGHASCYVKLDIINRILKEYYDIHPVVAIGVTDVSEEINKKAKLLRKETNEITDKYVTEFFDQMKRLNVLPPAFKLKVSDHMKVIIDFIDLLIRRRVAYIGGDESVYFSVEADPKYGRFRAPATEEGVRSIRGKRDPRDFALWKVDANAGPWHSPWGRGTPGWHIECSAMASSVFGDTVDLHSGGSDLIFPHHENEEAQSTCYHKSDQWVNYWLHTGLIKVSDVKMSKSLKNSHLISEFLENFKADHFRMFCLMSSYKADLNFDNQTIQLAVSTYEKIGKFLDVAESYVAGVWMLGNIDEAKILEQLEETKKSVKMHLANDFGTPEAVKAVMLLVKSCLQMLNEDYKGTCGRSPGVIAMLANYVKQFFQSFGVAFVDLIEKNESTSAINTVITAAVNARSQVRNMGLSLKKNRKKEGLVALCDLFREKLASSGVVITDLSPSLSQWSFKPSAADNKMLLKEVIDYTVWFRKTILVQAVAMTPGSDAEELSNICRYIKLYFGTLGVDIQDSANGKLQWTFPNPDKENSRLLEGVILSTLQFHSHVLETAEALPEQKTKEELFCYCESLISDLDELGVKVDEKKKQFEILDDAGTFLLNNMVDIIVHFRDQAVFIANTTEDANFKTNLFKKTGFSKKTLATFGLTIHEAASCLLSSWSMKFKLVNSFVFYDVVDITVNLLNNIVQLSNTTNDVIAKRIILEICHSVTADLRSMGIVTKNLGKNNPTWTFQPSKYHDGYPISCRPWNVTQEILSSGEHLTSVRDEEKFSLDRLRYSTNSKCRE